MPTLYNYGPSGNCYKVRLLLSQLGIPFERVEVKLRMSPGGFVASISGSSAVLRHNHGVRHRVAQGDDL